MSEKQSNPVTGFLFGFVKIVVKVLGLIFRVGRGSVRALTGRKKNSES